MKSDANTNSLKVLATPAGIEPATNSLEVVRKANLFNRHSDKTAAPAALFNKPEFQFVGMTTGEHWPKVGEIIVRERRTFRVTASPKAADGTQAA